MKLDLGNLTSWLGSDVRRLWATSFTVDEHEAFALFHRALGGMRPSKGVWLAYHRNALRRAGQGVMPRSWIRAVTVPPENPLPTYHPKLLLAKTDDANVLVVSTANLATDDLRHTRNLAVRLEISSAVSDLISKWIEAAPSDHRALCLIEDGGKLRVLPRNGNRSTLAQMATCLSRCARCTSSGEHAGQWVVAAPFWSPATVSSLLKLEPTGRIEAYFRTRQIWDDLAASVRDTDPELLGRVDAFELRERGHLPRWHHKIVGWRCCTRPQAHAALYLGSANATVCGFVGAGAPQRAVNWEAGVIWLGGGALWHQARKLARAGYAATRLGKPAIQDRAGLRPDDEIGPLDEDERERAFAAHAANLVRINRKSRTVSLKSVAGKAVRVVGSAWKLDCVEICVEEHNHHRHLKSLKQPGAEVTVPSDGRAQARAVFRRVDASSSRDFAETRIDLVELDAEPRLLAPTTRSSIESAMLGLMRGTWGSSSTSRAELSDEATGVTRTDVRFPFAAFFGLRRTNPAAANAWLERFEGPDKASLSALPEHWRRTVKALKAAR